MRSVVTRGLDRETLELTLAALRDFARRHLPAAKLLELDENDEFPEELVRALCGGGLGIHLLFIPEELGGMGGGAFDVYRVCETLAGIDLGVATGVLATFLGADPVAFGGTPEQRRHWLGRIAREGLLVACCATEPDAGSDLAALRTTARPVVDGGRLTGYRLQGTKQWITNGGFADLYSVLAVAPDGPSWFVVERGTPGLSWGRPEEKHGIRASNTAAVLLEDVAVPADRLVGGVEGLGLVQAQEVFGATRLMVAAFGLGAGWAALDRAVAYSTGRFQAGGPLSEKQGYTHKLLVPHAARLEAARAVVEETARRVDDGEGNLKTEGAIAKYLASEAGNAAAEAAIQALGGYGYTREHLVEKIKRDVRITTIYEGTSEILEMTIARDRWQRHLKTRGDHYRDRARGLERLDAGGDAPGAAAAALALHALAEILESARRRRLTRNQHVLLRLGELAARAEGAAALVRRARAAARGELPDKADRRFRPAALAALARVVAREAALAVGEGGLRWVVGAGEGAPSGADRLTAALGLAAIHRAQEGLVADMDRVADALYGRGGEAGEPHGPLRSLRSGLEME